MLNLCRHGSTSRVAPYGQLLSRRPRLNPTAPTVVCNTIATAMWNRVFIDVMNGRGIHIRDAAIVLESVVIPIGAIISVARISEAVIDTAVKADMRPPIARMIDINAVAVTPVRWCPERSYPRSNYPRSRDPIISGGRVIPVSGSPKVIVAGSGGLAVFRKRWRRFGSLYRLLIRRSLLVWRRGRGIVLIVCGRVILVGRRCCGNRSEISVRGISTRYIRGLILRSVTLSRMASHEGHKCDGNNYRQTSYICGRAHAHLAVR